MSGGRNTRRSLMPNQSTHCCGPLVRASSAALRRSLDGTGLILGYEGADARITARALPHGRGDSDYEIIFRCPWAVGAARYHRHGSGFGHRVSHCPSTPNGHDYILIDADGPEGDE